MGRILRYVLCLTSTVVLGVSLEGGDVLVSVRPYRRDAPGCPVCGERRARHDHLAERSWRALDLGRAKVFLRYAPARVSCPEHGVHEERLPWARDSRARMTREFEDWLACLAIHGPMSWVARQARVDWHSVGPACKRVYDEIQAQRGSGRFEGLRRIGIDETSYKKGHKYLTVVVDHDRGRVVWCHEGYGKEVLSLFPGGPAREQRRPVEVVTADGAKWTRTLVKRRCPNARWVMDPFHVVSWTDDALDEVRRDEWQVVKAEAKAATPKRSKPGRPRKGEGTPKEAKELQERAKSIKNSRYALARNPEDLTDAQRAKLKEPGKAGSHLSGAWEPEEDLRAVFRAEGADEAEALLADWLHSAAYRGIKPVVEVEKKVRRRRADVVEAVRLGISNGRVESLNQKIKTIVKVGYGFRNTDNLIAPVMLSCSDEHPALPWEDRKVEKAKRDARKEHDRERDRAKRKSRAKGKEVVAA